eukprot:4785633-Amphidinium_carterae.2
MYTLPTGIKPMALWPWIDFTIMVRSFSRSRGFKGIPKGIHPRGDMAVALVSMARLASSPGTCCTRASLPMTFASLRVSRSEKDVSSGSEQSSAPRTTAVLSAYGTTPCSIGKPGLGSGLTAAVHEDFAQFTVRPSKASCAATSLMTA